MLGTKISSRSEQKTMLTHSFLCLKPSVSVDTNMSAFQRCMCRDVSPQSIFVKSFFVPISDQEKVSDYEMKLMDLDVEQLGIPVSVFYIKLLNILRILLKINSYFSWSVRCSFSANVINESKPQMCF